MLNKIKIISGIILIVLALGFAIAGGIIRINKTIEVKKDLYDYIATVGTGMPVYTYTEKELSDGTVKVCVNKDNQTIGCRTVRADLRENYTKAVIESDIKRAKLKADNEKITIDKEIEGGIEIVKERA